MLSLISAFELILLIRGVKNWDLTRPDRLAYLISYIILLVASLTTLAAILYNLKRKTIFKALYYLTQIYGSVFILWATVVTSVDLYRGNTMIVYLTIIMVISVILRMNPILYTVMVVPTTALLVYFGYRFNNELVASSGYSINFGVFVIFALLLAYVQDRLTRKAFVAKQGLEHLSYYDQLTGVYNRHSLQKHIDEMEEDSIFYFGIVDADDFKHVNDIYGHNIGDDCLMNIAKLLRQEFGDQVYRYGGDEFAVISTHREIDLVESVNRINQKLAEKYKTGDIHISAGFYCPVSNKEAYKDYFKKADRALYEAKNSGKSKALIFNNEK